MTYPPQDPHQSYPPPPSDLGYPTQTSGSYASWGRRVGAYLVDSLTTLPTSLLATVLGSDGTDANGLPVYNMWYYIFTLLTVAIWGYNRWYQAGKTGQSWGRKALGIRMVSEATGQPIGPGMAFVRDLAHIVDSIICGIGYLFPLWDAKKQTIADKLVKTVVIG